MQQMHDIGDEATGGRKDAEYSQRYIRIEKHARYTIHEIPDLIWDTIRLKGKSFSSMNNVES